MANDFIAKFKLIDKLSDVYRLNLLGLPTWLLTHAVLNTIELSELVYYYIHEEPAYTALSRNILKRLSEYKGKTAIYDAIFEQLKTSSYVNRLRFRKLMDAVIESLDETRQQEYFTFFYNSSYRLELRAAIKMTGMIWSKDLGNRFLENYYQTGNPDLLVVLIANLEKDQFKQLATRIWKAGLSNYLKTKLINRVKGWPLLDLEFVRQADPGNFIVLVRHSSETVDDMVLLDCYNRIPKAYHPFALWNLGRMGKWELIKKPIEEFIEKPTATFPGFDSTMFE